MTRKFLSLAAASFVVLLFTTTPFIAHHSEAAQFDTTKPVKVSGVVKKVEWMNPHIWFYIDVKDEKGTVTTWGFSGLPPGMAIRKGFNKETLKVGARLFVEIVNVYRHARIGIIRSHVVIHGDRRRRRSGICRNVERLEHRISNHRDFRRSTIPGFWLICRRDHDSIVVAEITVLDSNRTISAARFHTLAQMEERTRDACTHALDVGIPDGDALRKIVSHPDARGPLLGIDQDRFVAAHGNGIDCQLIGRDNRQTLACRIPGAEVLDLPVPSECDSGLDRTIGFVIYELQHLLICRVY